MPPAVELTTIEVVPPALKADFHDVTGELVDFRAEFLELGRMADAPPVGRFQLVAVDVLHEAHAVGAADRTVVGCRFAHVVARAHELGMRVTDVETGEHTASQVS